MNFVKSFLVTSMQDVIQKATAAETLGLTYKLEGTLKEFTYDVMDGNIIGSLAMNPEKISYLKEYRGFKEEDLTSRHIRVNDDPYLPKKDIMELDVIEWQKRFFILDETELCIYSNN